MKKILVLFAVIAVMAMPVKAQLLYRISGNGLQKDSYIVGTFHLADGTFVDSIPGCREAMNSVGQVCGELEYASSFLLVDSMAVLNQKMHLPNGMTLRDVMTKEQFDKVDAFVEKVFGMKLSSQMLYAQMGNMTPASLVQTLEMKKYIVKMRGIDLQNTIDIYIQKVLHEAGKKTLGLETISFQAAVLFDAPMDDQVKALMCAIDNESINDERQNRIIKLYYEQKAEELYELSIEKMGNECDSKPEDMDRILFNRNANWIKQMPEIMKEESTMFVVGAAHLGGGRGVLKGLQQAGYKVEAVSGK